jgi:hypothetical protein
MGLRRMGFGSSGEKIKYFEPPSLEWVAVFEVGEEF